MSSLNSFSGNPQQQHDSPVASSSDKRDVAAKSLRYQKLEKALDLGPFIKQTEQLLSRPIKIPGSTIPHPATIHRGRSPSIFSVRGIWPVDDMRKSKVSKLYSFQNCKNREWVKDLLLDESDSDEDVEPQYSHRDVKMILRLHRQRRKLQKQFHEEGGQPQQQSTYYNYSAGMLSVQDPYPEPASSIAKARPGASAVTVAASTAVKSEAPTVSCPSSSDESPEPLAVDANFPTSAVVPLPPLSH